MKLLRIASFTLALLPFAHAREPRLANVSTLTRVGWIPTTSVDEFAATLGTWFGVSATDLPIVLPNIGRFAKPNLGFLA